MKTIACILLLLNCLKGEMLPISASDAEKVLGQKVLLTASSVEAKGGISKQRLTYTGTADTTAHLYALSAKYAGATEAGKAYTAIIAGNVGMPGQEKLTSLGDEAFFHTDKQHFYLLIFRKGNQMVTLKINRINTKTSAAELRKLAAKLGQSL